MVDAFCVLPQVLCHLAFTVTSSLGASINVNLLLQNLILFKKGQNQRKKIRKVVNEPPRSQLDRHELISTVICIQICCFQLDKLKGDSLWFLAICVIHSVELKRSLKDKSSLSVIILQIKNVPCEIFEYLNYLEFTGK